MQRDIHLRTLVLDIKRLGDEVVFQLILCGSRL